MNLINSPQDSRVRNKKKWQNYKPEISRKTCKTLNKPRRGGCRINLVQIQERIQIMKIILRRNNISIFKGKVFRRKRRKNTNKINKRFIKKGARDEFF